MVLVPAGPFIMGSTPEEREYGYQPDEQRGSSVARGNRWFEHETRAIRKLDAYLIDDYPVTNADYKAFVDATGHPAPFVTQEVWEGYHLIHGYDTVQRFLWKNRTYPRGRGHHPVVLASQADATAYCAWRGAWEKRRLRLPTEIELDDHNVRIGEAGNLVRLTPADKSALTHFQPAHNAECQTSYTVHVLATAPLHTLPLCALTRVIVAQRTDLIAIPFI
jgi:Sulfatase-modifying factor enzyme 1